MAHTIAKGAAPLFSALLAASTASAGSTDVPLLAQQPAPQTGRLTIDPQATLVAENHLMSGVPALFNGLVIHNFLGANRFYSAGITGQGTAVSNIEAGHIWNGHVTLPHVVNFTTGTGALGETDKHATAVGMVIGGRHNPANPRDHQLGIAFGTDLRSGAIATSWNPAPGGGNPRPSVSFNTTLNSTFSTYAAAFGVSDVINSSFGFPDPTGTSTRAIGVDGLARMNPRTTFVGSAGNGGPGANTVTASAAGYNSIAVANLGNPNSYDVVNNNSSRGPQDYSDPVNGVIAGARVAVDIAAPGTNLTSAYYGGETGGNSPVLGGAPGGGPGSPTTYSF